MTALQTTLIYMETSIPPGVTMSEYRRARPRPLTLRRRLTAHLRRSR